MHTAIPHNRMLPLQCIVTLLGLHETSVRFTPEGCITSLQLHVFALCFLGGAPQCLLSLGSCG